MKKILYVASIISLSAMIAGCGSEDIKDTGTNSSNQTSMPTEPLSNLKVTPELINVTGFYVGQIEPNSVEISVNGEKGAYRIEELTETFKVIEDGSTVSFSYSEAENGQKTIHSILLHHKLTEDVNVPTTKDERRMAEVMLDVTIEGMVESKKAILNQKNGYFVYVFEDYALEGNSIVFKNNKDFFTEIRVVKDKDIASLKAEATEKLNEVGNVVEMTGDMIFDADFRESHYFLHASNSQKTQQIILIQNLGEMYEFHMNFPNSEEAEGVTPQFFEMLKTVSN